MRISDWRSDVYSSDLSSGGDRAQRRRMMLRFRCFEAILQGSAAVAPRFPLLSAIIELRTHGAKPRLRDAVWRAAMRGDEAAAPQPVEQRQAGVRENVAVARAAQRLDDMAAFAAPMADHAALRQPMEHIRAEGSDVG